MKKIRKMIDFDKNDQNNFEKVRGKSMTLPMQSLTVDELMQKYVLGQNTVAKDGVYYVDDKLDDETALEVYDENEPDDPLIDNHDRGLEIKHMEDQKRLKSKQAREEALRVKKEKEAQLKQIEDLAKALSNKN